MVPLSVFAVGLLVLVLYWIYWSVSGFSLLKKLGIDGPKPEFFFGNSRLRQKLGLIKFMTHAYENFGPISGFYLGRNPFVIVFDLEILKEVMVKEFSSFMDRPPFPDLLRKRPNKPRGLLTSRGSVWKTSRQTLSPSFSSAKMKMMVPLISKSVNGLNVRMKGIADSKESVDVFKVFGSFTMETIVATAFGRVIDIQGGETDELTRAANIIFRGAEEGTSTSLTFMTPLFSNFPWLVPFLRYFLSRSERGKALETIEGTALTLLNERRKSGFQGKYKDLLQLMIDANVQEEGDKQSCPVMTNEQIVAHSLTFFLAGYETTANALSYTAYLLALHPEIQKRLQTEIDVYFEDNPGAELYEAAQEINYLEMVLNESLRLYPPAPSTLRYCQKSVKINGFTIPEGVSVMIPIAHLHKSPEYWEEPDTFDPERFSPVEKAKRPQLCYMPFGNGPRNCIGMRFAMLEAKLALIEILKRFIFARSPDTEVPLTTVCGVTMAPKHGIHLRILPRD